MRRTVLVFGSVLSLALAACGGGEAGEPADESPADETVEQTTSDGQTSSDEAEGTPDEVQAMGQPEEPAKVTYEMTGAGSEGSEQLTLAWDPPRFAMLFEDGKMIFDDEGTIFCDAAGEGCFRMSSGQNTQQMGAGMGPFFGFTNAWQEGAEELPGATRTSETEIAGRTAVCATYDASEYDSSMQGEAEYCYDPDTGLLLRWSGTDAEGNTQTVTAVEVGDPEASDFEPTGPVQEMPGGSGG